jgi:hypothetical protein
MSKYVLSDQLTSFNLAYNTFSYLFPDIQTLHIKLFFSLVCQSLDSLVLTFYRTNNISIHSSLRFTLFDDLNYKLGEWFNGFFFTVFIIVSSIFVYKCIHLYIYIYIYIRNKHDKRRAHQN